MPVDQTAIAKTRLNGLTQQAIQSILATATALEYGRVDEAERNIIGLLAGYPDHAEVLRLHAGILSLRGDRQGAINAMRRAVALRPNDALYHNTLGAVLGENTDIDGAIACLRRACELQPDLASAWYNLGLLLMRSINRDESADALRRAVELEPTHAHARAMLAEKLRSAGRYEEAAAEYRRVIAQKPDAGTAWWGLADLKTIKLSAADVTAMQEAMRRPSASEDDKIAIGYALAKALDDQRRYAESMEVLAQTHARARSRRRWDAQEASARVDATLAQSTPPPLPANTQRGNEVIFIVSLPRAGSTLTEQILASHSQVLGAGELTDLPQIIGDESRRRGKAYPHWIKDMTPADWERLGNSYLERTAHWRRNRPRITDKLPNNWQYASVILSMLPQARIVIVRRDPLENCLAVYRQYLANAEYTRTFDDLAAYWHDFDRASRYWLQAYPGRVYENIYEELVADPETKIRELLDFCGLPFEQGCIDFHETEREVHTPSASQVRQPMRRDTARAPRYGALLDPLRDALQRRARSIAQAAAAPAPDTDTLLAEFAAEAARAGEAAALHLLGSRLDRPPGPETWIALITGLLRAGFVASALELSDAALALFPHDVALLYWRGNALRVGGRSAEAEQALRALLHAHPDHRDAALSLAFMLRQQGRTQAAAQLIVASTRARAPDPAETQANLVFLRECGAFDAACELAAGARARWPDNADIAALAGEFALALGRFEVAREALRFAVDKDPRKGPSWLRLSRCQRYADANDADVRRFENAWRNMALAPSPRACVGFALGKARDDLSDHAGAAAVLREANALARAGAPWNGQAWNAFVDWQIAQPVARAESREDFEPVFIVGLPRTGTTLAATLLARDPRVRDRGELNWIAGMHDQLAAQNALRDPAALQAAAALVRTQMRRDDAPARWYLDKNPLNFRYLGFIAALFPRARIVHCRRDLRDTALSLWMQHFDHADAGFAYDFDDIAAYARGYERLMAHWRATLPVPILDLGYEALVGDAATTLRSLAQFVGADADALNSTAPATGTIATASVWQARQPLNTASVGRWRNYAPYLPELAKL